MKYAPLIFPLMLCSLMMGCGGSNGPAAVSVSGTVTLDGQPMPDVEVYFLNNGFEGFGKTDADGHFRLVNGAMAGPNKVYLKKFDTGGGTLPQIDLTIEGMDQGQIAAMVSAQGGGQNMAQVKGNAIPMEYRDPATTRLTYPVPDQGTSSADFQLTSS